MATPSRRDLAVRSDETALSEGVDRCLVFSLGREAETDESPQETLMRLLSVDSVVSTAPSFENTIQIAASHSDPNAPLRVIGLGSCGSVFEIPGTERAFKKGASQDSIRQDYRLTNRVHDAVLATRELLEVKFDKESLPRTPKAYRLIKASQESWWNDWRHRLPEEHQATGTVYEVDRILPVPAKIRKVLTMLYFDEKNAEAIAANPENKDCLIRVYLGAKETVHNQDTLRNFMMGLDGFDEEFQEKLATEMAIGLAIIHWKAKVNAMDTEFVLGTTATKEREGLAPFQHRANFQRREIHLWMLDFDKAEEIKFTKKDVDRLLVPAFLGNDPYFPRPDVDKDLWGTFSEVYLEASEIILQSLGEKGSVLKLPERFLDGVERQIAATADWDPECDIVFGE